MSWLVVCHLNMFHRFGRVMEGRERMAIRSSFRCILAHKRIYWNGKEALVVELHRRGFCMILRRNLFDSRLNLESIFEISKNEA
jgi:hypothetical protein